MVLTRYFCGRSCTCTFDFYVYQHTIMSSLILRALEGFNKLPRDIRVYVLGYMLDNVDIAACYLAVFQREPSDTFVHSMVARCRVYEGTSHMFVQLAVKHGFYDPRWEHNHKYAVICGAAEAGNTELFFSLARRRNYENIIMQIGCHPVIWNALYKEVCLGTYPMIRNRVALGYPLTGCMVGDDVHKCLDQNKTAQLIRQTHTHLRKSTVEWLAHHKISIYWIMTGVCNLDDADLVQYILDNGWITIDKLRRYIYLYASMQPSITRLVRENIHRRHHVKKIVV